MKKAARLPVQAQLKSMGLSIGVLARLTGVTASAIRYYEASGLLRAPARVSGRRIYDAAALAQLKRIVAARALGFSIRELRGMSSASIPDLKRSAHERAAMLRALIERMQENASRLENLSRCGCEAGGTCRL